MTQLAPDQRCAAMSLLVDEPLAGTASFVRAGYLVIEDPGPWGRAGITESGLGEIGAQVEAAAKAVGVKALVMRATDREGRAMTRRRVYAATHGHDRQLVAFTVASPEDLLSLDLTAFDGDLLRIHPAAEEVTEPLLLVCTHAKRDQCCAIQGVPLARALHGGRSGTVFECSHLGGHRFAPTALVLPSGAVYGRLTVDSASKALELAREDAVLPEVLRGLSHLQPAAQAADIALRERLALHEIDGVRLATGAEGDGQDADTIALEADDARWRVEISERPNPPRPPSCGREPEPSTSYLATILPAR